MIIMFSELSESLQQVISFSHAYLSSLFFMTIVLGISLFYIFYYKKNLEKPTAMMSVGVLRLVFTGSSYLTMFLTPYFIYIMNPAVAENALENVYMIYYNLMIALMSLIAIIDFARLIPNLLMKMMGADMNDEGMQSFYNDIKKEFAKLPYMRFKNGKR